MFARWNVFTILRELWGGEVETLLHLGHMVLAVPVFDKLVKAESIKGDSEHQMFSGSRWTPQYQYSEKKCTNVSKKYSDPACANHFFCDLRLSYVKNIMW